MGRHAFWIVAVCWLGGSSVQAASYVMMLDQDLADQAPLIVQGRVLGSGPAADGTAATEVGLAVERVLKGQVPRSILRVRVPGGVDRRGNELSVAGAPRFIEGGRVLLMLGPRGDGSYAPWQFALGAFHGVPTSGRLLAVRHLEVALELGGRSEAGDTVRDLDRFGDWLADRAAGRLRAPDYFVTPGASEAKDLITEYNLYRISGRTTRWFRFDDDEYVQLRPHESGQEGLPGRGFDELTRALAAWTDDPNTNVLYEMGSTTTRDAGLREFDDNDVVLWGDPHQEIPGSFDCRRGGILAIGGSWARQNPPGRYEGVDYNVIEGGDIITNDGIGCFLAPRGAVGGEELLTHELGHTLGLLHSCDDSGAPACRGNPRLAEAVMRPEYTGNGRGAQIFPDDREGILQLYPLQEDGGGCGTVVPTRGGPGEGLGVGLLVGLVGLAVAAGRRRAAASDPVWARAHIG